MEKVSSNEETRTQTQLWSCQQNGKSLVHCLGATTDELTREVQKKGLGFNEVANIPREEGRNLKAKYGKYGYGKYAKYGKYGKYGKHGKYGKYIWDPAYYYDDSYTDDESYPSFPPLVCPLHTLHFLLEATF